MTFSALKKNNHQSLSHWKARAKLAECKKGTSKDKYLENDFSLLTC